MPGNTNRHDVRIPSSNGVRAPALETNADPGVRDTGAAQLFDQAAQQYGQMSAKVGALADRAAAKEGEEAGSSAGLDPEFRPQKNMTIRAEAFDRAGLSVASSRLRMAMAADLDDAYDKYGDDPKRLKAALDGRAKAFVEQGMALDAKIGASLTLSFRQSSLSMMRRSTRAQAVRIAAGQREAVASDVSDRLKRIGREAYDAGLDNEADAHLASSRAQLLEKLAEHDVRGKPLFTAHQRQAALTDFDATVMRERLYGALSRADGHEGKAQLVMGFEEGWKKGEYPELGPDDFRRISTGLRRELRREETAQSVLLRTSKKKTDILVGQLSKGYAVNEDQRSEMLAGIRASGDVGVELANEADRNMTLLDHLRVQPPQKIRETIEQERAIAAKKGVSASRLHLIEMAENLEAEARKQLKVDPLGWMERTGQMDVQPLDMTSAENMHLRVAQAEKTAHDYGMEPRYLRPDERQAMTVMMRQGPKSLAEVVRTVSKGFGPAAVKVFGELSDHAPELAHIGGLAATGADPEAIANAAVWMRLKAEKGYKSRLSSTDEKGWFHENVGALFGDRLAMSQAVRQVAGGIADILAKKRGEKTVSKETYKQAVNQALGRRVVNGVAYGGVIDYSRDGVTYSGGATVEHSGSHKIIIPSWVRADRFESVIDGIGEGILAQLGSPMHGNGAPVTPADIKRARLETIGDGRYLVNFGTRSEPQYFYPQGHKGAKWVLDMKLVYPSASVRDDDAFLGNPLMGAQ